MAVDRLEKARCHKSDMHVAGESDSSIVPRKPANNSSVPLLAESAEGRGLTKENAKPSLLDRTQRRTPRMRGAALACDRRHNVYRRSFVSEVGAVCGSSARTDLCGGRAAMPVPTALTYSLTRRLGGGWLAEHGTTLASGRVEATCITRSIAQMPGWQFAKTTGIMDAKTDCDTFIPSDTFIPFAWPPVLKFALRHPQRQIPMRFGLFLADICASAIG